MINNSPVPHPGQAGTKKDLACREITKYKSQITNKEEPFGQILYAFGGAYKMVFFSSPIGLFVVSDIVIWNLFVICIL